MKVYDKFLPLFDLESDRYDTFVLTGGRGGWKTGSACRAVLVDMMKRKRRVVCFRETKTSQKSSLISEFQELIDGEFKGRGFVYNTESVENVFNDSNIIFLGLKDSNQNSREAIKGLAQVDIWLIDEAQAVSLEVWKVLLKTIRKEGAKLIVVYNRISEELPLEEALFLNYKEMMAPEKTYFVEVNYPELAQKGLISERFLSYAEQVRINRPEEYEEEYLNIPHGGNKANVVKYWSKDNICEDIRYCNDLDVYWSLDFNVNPAMSTLAHFDGNKFYYFDEIVINNCITQDVVDEFMRRFPLEDFKGTVQICGDASGKYRKTQSRYSDYAIIVNTLARHNYRYKLNLRGFNPGIMQRVNAFNRQVLGDDGQRHVLVHPRCKWLIYNMKNLKFKPGTNVIDTPTPKEIEASENKMYLGHIFDAASYMVEYFKPVVKE